jgi:hypothetical protein
VICSNCGTPHAVRISVAVEPLARAQKRDVMAGKIQTVATRVKPAERQAYQSTAFPAWDRDESGEFVEIDRDKEEPKKPQPSERTKAPARAPTIESDVSVPLRQALIYGVFVSVPVGGLWFILGGEKPTIVFGMLLFLVSAVAWHLNLKELRELLWRIEEWFDKDSAGDKQIGPPPQKPETVVAEVVEQGEDEGGRFERYRYGDIAISRDKLRLVARVIDNGTHSFSRDGLKELLTQAEYRKFAASLESMGLLVTLPNNHRELTVAGKAWLQKAAE